MFKMFNYFINIIRREFSCDKTTDESEDEIETIFQEHQIMPTVCFGKSQIPRVFRSLNSTESNPNKIWFVMEVPNQNIIDR